MEEETIINTDYPDEVPCMPMKRSWYQPGYYVRTSVRRLLTTTYLFGVGVAFIEVVKVIWK